MTRPATIPAGEPVGVLLAHPGFTNAVRCAPEWSTLALHLMQDVTSRLKEAEARR